VTTQKKLKRQQHLLGVVFLHMISTDTLKKLYFSKAKIKLLFMSTRSHLLDNLSIC